MNLIDLPPQYPTEYSFKYPQINFINNLNSIKVPLSYKDALKSPNWPDWQRAMRDELNSLKNKCVFEFVPDEGARQLALKWTYALKSDGAGHKFKARLVARGDCQTPDQYSETYAPTTDFAIMRYILSYARARGLIVWNIDIKTAFLNAKLIEKIFVKAPPGLECPPGLVIRLMRALYGLKQAGHNWHQTIKEILLSLRFVQHHRVPTLFIHTTIKNLMICIYVDDGLLVAPDLSTKDEFIAQLSARVDLHDRGPLADLLGVTFKLDNDLWTYSQRKLIGELLERFDIKPHPKVTTPLPAHEVQLPLSNAQCCDSDLYASIIGSLLYIGRISRPDILFPVVQLSQFREDPKIPHLRKLYRIMIYLANTLDRTMMIHPAGNLSVYTDSSFNTNHDSRNFNGTVVLVGQAIVHWTSTKMKFVVLSTDEAEIVGCLQSVRQLIYYRYMICELHHSPKSIPSVNLSDSDEEQQCTECTPAELLIDNKGTIAFCKSGYGKRTNYLNTKFRFLVEQYDAEAFQPTYVSSAENLADIFTKNLPLTLLEPHLSKFFN